MSFCGKCGREVPEGALFCMKCGVPIPEKQSFKTVEPVVNTDETKEPMPEIAPSAPEAIDHLSDGKTTPSTERKRPAGVIPIIISAIICLILIGGIYIYQSRTTGNELIGSGDSLTRMIDQANSNMEYIDQ